MSPSGSTYGGPGGVAAPRLRRWIRRHSHAGRPRDQRLERAQAASIFEHHFQTTAPTVANPHPPAKDGITAQFDISGDGTVMEGMEPPRMAHHARPLNASSIGSETGHAGATTAATTIRVRTSPTRRGIWRPCPTTAAGSRCRATTPTTAPTTCPGSSCGSWQTGARSSLARPRAQGHDCPGPMFDWHRFARELWDWWWHPFDFDASRPCRPGGRRGRTRRHPRRRHPVSEHFWGRRSTCRRPRRPSGMHGRAGSPWTFELPAESRMYAMANGEIVARAVPAPRRAVDLGHDASSATRSSTSLTARRRRAAPGRPAPSANRINYDVAPRTVYALYMHLARPAGIALRPRRPGQPGLAQPHADRASRSASWASGSAIAGRPGDPAATWNDRPPGTS